MGVGGNLGIFEWGLKIVLEFRHVKAILVIWQKGQIENPIFEFLSAQYLDLTVIRS